MLLCVENNYKNDDNDDDDDDDDDDGDEGCHTCPHRRIHFRYIITHRHTLTTPQCLRAFPGAALSRAGCSDWEEQSTTPRMRRYQSCPV